MGLQAEASSLLKQHQLLAGFGREERFKLLLELLEIFGIEQSNRELLPVQARGGVGNNIDASPALNSHRQHLASLVVDGAGKAIGLWRSGIPGAWVDLLQPVPVAEGYVVDLLQQACIELEAVVGAAGVVIVSVEIGGSKAMH